MKKNSKQNIWLCDLVNVATAGYGLCLSAKDMVKIGNLCLDKGIYQEKQIISTKWIEEIVEPTSCPLERFQNSQYGYLWWILDTQKNIYAAIGDSGNILYLDSENKVVIAITSYFKPSVLDRVNLIEEYIKPLILE